MGQLSSGHVGEVEYILYICNEMNYSYLYSIYKVTGR